MLSASFLYKCYLRLMPNGKAFQVKEGGLFQRLLMGVATAEARLLSDVSAIYDGLLPDNPLFTEVDAAIWERKYGIVPVAGATLEERKQAIRVYASYPGTTAPRLTASFMQAQLREAGFTDLYVLENFDQQPISVFVPTLAHATHSSLSKHGGMYHGGGYQPDFVVNSLDRADDKYYPQHNIQSIFFVCGQDIGDFVDVPESRERELRHLILKMKPQHMAACLFVNYV